MHNNVCNLICASLQFDVLGQALTGFSSLIIRLLSLTLISWCSVVPQSCNIGENVLDSVKRLGLTTDGKGAVFDVGSEHVDTILEAAGEGGGDD